MYDVEKTHYLSPAEGSINTEPERSMQSNDMIHRTAGAELVSRVVKTDTRDLHPA